MEALAFIIPVAIAIAFVYYLIRQARYARETYGFGLVVNSTFVLVALAVISAIVTLMASTGGSENSANTIVWAVVSIGLLAGAGYVNVRRSNTKFGLWFTFLQLIAATGIIVPIILMIAYWRSRKVNMFG